MNEHLPKSNYFADTLKNTHSMQWWKSFNDPPCNSIIEKVLHANYGIKLSVLKHKIVTNLYKRSVLNYYPSFSSSLGYARERSLECNIDQDMVNHTIYPGK